MRSIQAYARIGRSFLLVCGLAVVAGATARAETAKAINWPTNAVDLNLRGQNGQRFAFILPANGTFVSIFGTDVYTDDSSIGSAAVHAGLITLKQGGTVTIEIRPDAGSYTGSTRNGVTSHSFGSWLGSYVFVKNSGPTIKTRQSSYTTSDNITVDATGLPGNRQGWFGVAPVGSTDDQASLVNGVAYWDYASGNQSDTRTFPPLPAGQYEARAWVQGRVQARSAFSVSAMPVTVGKFDGIWSTDLDIGLYIGLVQNGTQVRGYYYASDGKWYPLLSGTVSGGVLRGSWDAGIPWFSGAFTFTQSTDGKSFRAAATALDGIVTIEFSGQFYQAWSR